PIVERRGFIVRVTSSDPERPQHLYSDACPLPGFSKDTLDDVHAALAAPFALQRPPSLDWALYATHCWSDEPCTPPTALLLGDGDDGLDAIDGLVDGGTVKLKVGRRALADDLARVDHAATVVRQRRGHLRLDGNRRLDVDAAIALADAAGGVLEFFEEPVIVSKQKQLPSSFPLALDEWIDELRERGGVRRLPKAAAWIVKPTVLGSSATLEVVNAARGSKVKLVISSAYESAVGRQSLGCFARFVDTMLHREHVVHGLGTGPAFADDIDVTALDALPWRVWKQPR
ncbi:MAG TPA: enolase C-terminal domain-like protein, partial [Myxococcota bacterium]